MKQFPRRAVLSAATGFMVCKDFSEVHECIEHLAGHPVWTHQIPAWFDENRSKVQAAFPDLASYDISGLNADTGANWIRERAAYLDEMIDVETLGWLGGGDPLARLPDGADVVVLPAPGSAA